MTRTRLASLAAVAPASAQVETRPVAPAPAAPGVVSQQRDATGNAAAVTYSPTGRPADAISNNSAAAGNANRPSRVAPQGGGSDTWRFRGRRGPPGPVGRADR